MNEYKVIITKDEEKINQMIKEGWFIDTITAQHVATGSISTSKGNFLIVFKRLKLKSK
jgi:hypothetical protein